MLPAVELDRESFLFAEEVDDVFADRMLASEFHSGKPASSQPAPEERLAVRLILAKPPRSVTAEAPLTPSLSRWERDRLGT